MPLEYDPKELQLKLNNMNYWATVRLKPGVTLAQLNADIARMLPIVMRSPSFRAPQAVYPAKEGVNPRPKGLVRSGAGGARAASRLG